ncbi:MAG: DegT/DnrJ/EryC1/StrS family aminotransferase [Gammaproteobacteria bacterium]|nr:DegT/DnrJ/EryC1/StrS family aminotransferase [Gammaproteobacteria bacterium]NNF59906.1 DegT/DnrJ/EryC1/StrS family aminotransferase [Gammaproteobacteria bacterium]NNM21640.1 DegT/DnrJ/EryC1/StrS family aminotransferase [Gammaproteobacteria bacterium]
MLSKWPMHDAEQIDAVTRVLQSGRTNYWSGEEGRAFESEFARYCDVPYAVAVANGTVALELALRALEIGDGDEVIVPASSFVATAAAVVTVGAKPVFADINATTHTLDAATIEARISARTRAVIAVHLNGCPCPMDEIMQLAQRNGLMVIEDCAQAHGARWNNRPVGSFGAAAAFSFCQDKILSTGGEGGLLLCAERNTWHRAVSYKDHGKKPGHQHAHGGSYRYVHESIGSNWRMTEMQAAIGRVQLRRLDKWVSQRSRIAAALVRQLGDSILQPPQVPAAALHAWYRLPFMLPPDALVQGWSRDRVLARLREAGVPCLAGSCPELYLEHSLERFAPRQRCRNAANYGANGLCLTMNPCRSAAEVSWVAEQVRLVLNQVVR